MIENHLSPANWSIGTFRKEDSRFVGTILTLTLDLRDVVIAKQNGAFTVTASHSGAGHATIGTAEHVVTDGISRLDVMLDDPALPAPIACKLVFLSQGFYSLIWERNSAGTAA